MRTAFDEPAAELEARRFSDRALHGEPQDGNFLATPSGLRWIDFEGACRGPLEWDLVFLSADAVAIFGEFDPELLALLRVVNGARVATSC